MKPAPLSAIHQAVSCALLGLRDGFSPRLLLFSLGLWLGSMTLWSVVLLFAWAQVKMVAGFLAAWALLGIFAIFPHWLPASAQAKLAGVPLRVGAEALLGPFFTVATWIALVLIIFLLVLITVRVALEFGLMPLIRRKVMESYPPFPPKESSSLLDPFKKFGKMILLIVFIGGPCLLIPVVNMALLFVLFGYLNVRTLVNEALDGLASPTELRRIIHDARMRMILLGSLFAAVQTIPFIGFISSAWVGAGTCHLCFRELLRLRVEEKTAAV